MARECGDTTVEEGRDCMVCAYVFFARYVLMPWESCLDVGGGLGDGLRILRRRSGSARAIDRDARLCDRGVEEGRVEDEPDCSVDWVLAVDVIEHVEQDREFLKQLWRVARKGVFLTTPNLEHHPDRNWPFHVREYTCAQFRAMVDEELSSPVCLHMGGGAYGSQLSIRHLLSKWEHQAVLCFKKDMIMRRALLGSREVAKRWLQAPFGG